MLPSSYFFWLLLRVLQAYTMEDLVIPGHSGAVSPCREVEALAGALRAMAADPAAAARMGEAAKALVLERFGVEQARDGVLQALRQTLVLPR